MKQTGCYHIKFGIEAGTQTSLDTIKKGITPGEALEAFTPGVRILAPGKRRG